MCATDPAATFDKQGYYVAKHVFSPERIAALESDFDRIVSQLLESKEEINARWGGTEMDRIGKDTVVLHTHNVQRYSAEWLAALMDPAFLAAPRAILGNDIVLHHTKLFLKPPEKGAPFPMHQDWSYFPTLKDSMIAGIIHVSEADDPMGCLRVVPESHRYGRLQDSHGQAENEILSRHRLEDALPLEAEPGDVVWFHYFTIHGSMPNRSPRTRKTVLVQLYAGDDAVEPGNLHPDEQLVLSGWNHLATRSSAGGQKRES